MSRLSVIGCRVGSTTTNNETIGSGGIETRIIRTGLCQDNGTKYHRRSCTGLNIKETNTASILNLEPRVTRADMGDDPVRVTVEERTTGRIDRAGSCIHKSEIVTFEDEVARVGQKHQ